MTNVAIWHFKKGIFHKVRKVNWHNPTLRYNTALQNVLAPYSRTTTQLVHNRICFHPSKHVHLLVYSTTGNNSKKEYNQGFFGNKNIRVWHFRLRSSRKRTLQRDGANTAQWRACYNDHRGVGTLGKTMQLSFVSHVQSFAIKLNYCTGKKKNVSVLKDQEKVDQDNIF